MVASFTPILKIEEVRKTYGGTDAVAEVTLDILRGSFVALVGASGSGKSTLLKTINCLLKPTSGRVLIGCKDMTHMAAPMLRRQIGYVFQRIGLFPHMSIAENIGIGPRLAGMPAKPERIAELLKLVDLNPALAAEYRASSPGVRTWDASAANAHDGARLSALVSRDNTASGV